jgi:hypothetical protein
MGALRKDEVGYYVYTPMRAWEPLATVIIDVLPELTERELHMNWTTALNVFALLDGELVDIVDFGSGEFQLLVDDTMNDHFVRVR